ncbi:MAG: small basic protein [Candidatus Omnitrophica bacterium]|nr:small basic protein [Candidatus Omnitrophota bacterium]
MSLHPSLKVDSSSTQQRTVLTRIERIKDLMKKGLWNEGRSVTSLPKTKIIKIKTAKSAKKKEEEGAAEGAAPAAAPAAGAAKAAPGAKAVPAAKKA